MAIKCFTPVLATPYQLAKKTNYSVVAQRVSLEYKPVPLFLSIFNQPGGNNRRYLAKMCAFTHKVHERNCVLTWGRQTVMYARDHSIYSSSKFIVHSIAAIIYVCMYTYKSCTPAAGIRRYHSTKCQLNFLTCTLAVHRKCTGNVNFFCTFHSQILRAMWPGTFPFMQKMSHFLLCFCIDSVHSTYHIRMQVHFLRAGNITCFAQTLQVHSTVHAMWLHILPMQEMSTSYISQRSCTEWILW